MSKTRAVDVIVAGVAIHAYIVAWRLAVVGARCWRNGLCADSHDKMIGY